MSFMEENAPAVPIIQHPDVRRQLLTMKAYVESMRSLLYYVGYCDDMIEISDDDAEKAKYKGLVDILIPLAKGYVSDHAYDVCNIGMQVYGGYGYITEYPQEQFVRDCRITMIYEGTNGIQAMDLLGRKLGMNEGKPIMDLLGEVQSVIAMAKAIPSLTDLADRLTETVNKLAEVAMHMGKTAMSAKALDAFAFAYPFMEVMGDVTMAWMLLWRASIAAKRLEEGAKKKDQAFYEGQTKSAEFFIHSILPTSLGKMNAILNCNDAITQISEDAFGGK
jgi:hypothetical protein